MVKRRKPARTGFSDHPAYEPRSFEPTPERPTKTAHQVLRLKHQFLRPDDRPCRRGRNAYAPRAATRGHCAAAVCTGGKQAGRNKRLHPRLGHKRPPNYRQNSDPRSHASPQPGEVFSSSAGPVSGVLILRVVVVGSERLHTRCGSHSVWQPVAGCEWTHGATWRGHRGGGFDSRHQTDLLHHDSAFLKSSCPQLNRGQS